MGGNGDGSSGWIPANQVRDLDRVPGSGFSTGSGPAIHKHLGHKPAVEADPQVNNFFKTLEEKQFHIEHIKLFFLVGQYNNCLHITPIVLNIVSEPEII